VNFDGSNDYVAISDTSSLSFGDASSDSPFSVSAWVYIRDTDKFRIIGKCANDSGGMEWALITDGNDDFRLILYDATTTNYISQKTDSTISADVWLHLAATYSGNGANTGILLYVNGSLVSSTGANSGSYTSMHSTSADIEIGRLRYSVSSSDYANGNIDEVAIWDTALDGDAVKAIYNGGNPTDLTNNNGAYDEYTDNLQGYWRMGDGDTYPTITDNSSNSNDGTMTNMASNDIEEDTP